MAKPKRVGGTLQVPIEVRRTAMTLRQARLLKARRADQYPFGEIEPANVIYGTIEGESFWMPDTAANEGLIQTASRRYYLFQFVRRAESRTVDGQEERGIRIWKVRREDLGRWAAGEPVIVP